MKRIASLITVLFSLSAFSAEPTTVCYIHHGQDEPNWQIPEATSWSVRYYVLQYTDTYVDPVNGGVTRPTWGYAYNMQGDQVNLSGVTTGRQEGPRYLKRIALTGYAQQHNQPSLRPEPQYLILRNFEFYGDLGTLYPTLEEGWVSTNNMKPHWYGYDLAGNLVRGVNDAPSDLVASKVPCETLPKKPVGLQHPGTPAVGFESQLDDNVHGFDAYR